MSSSTETADGSADSDVTCTDTELTLGLPRDRGPKAGAAGAKRAFAKTVGPGRGSSGGSKQSGDIEVDAPERSGASQASSAGKVPASKAQVLGWPPVRSFRKKAMESGKYVKVAVDGAAYLRKVDLQAYNSYDELFKALEGMFNCTVDGNYLEESKVMDPAKGMAYVPTYKDDDGDWMLVGDVPWKMFTESCTRIRLMKSSDAAVIAPRTPK